MAFRVAKVLKGPSAPAVRVQTDSSGTSCGYSFKVGIDYIVYAYRQGLSLATDICSPTTTLAHGQVHLDYFAIQDPAAVAIVDGAVTGPPLPITNYRRNPVGAVRVTAEVNGAMFTTTADRNGHFHFYNIPPGRVTITATDPKDRYLFPVLVFRASPGACLSALVNALGFVPKH